MKFSFLAFSLLLLLNFPVSAQDGHRKHFTIPDIEGFHTLKGDFHIHTVFSDGLVWPDLRVLEAWTEGLDVISITEHIEYQPFKENVKGDHNRAYDLAAAKADELGILLIRGSEITRKMPPGHSNALFTTDNNLLETPKWEDAFTEAKKQGAFIFWNHPGWKAQQPDSMLWFPEHTLLQSEGKMHGIEIVNYKEYYPGAFQWALDKKLTIMGNSDIHGSIFQEYDISAGKYRPLTLVFTRERSIKGVKDALFEGRTAVLYNGTVYGREEWVNKLYKACIGVEPDVAAASGKSRSIFITNYSSIDLYLTPGKEAEKHGMIYPQELPAHSTIRLTAWAAKAEETLKPLQQFEFSVDNMLVAPEKPLKVNLKF